MRFTAALRPLLITDAFDFDGRRASAMDELIASGTLEDFTSGGQTQLDREL